MFQLSFESDQNGSGWSDELSALPKEKRNELDGAELGLHSTFLFEQCSEYMEIYLASLQHCEKSSLVSFPEIKTF